MCEFISWIEKNGKHYFLTSEDLASKRGKELRAHCRSDDDLVGHGAIRWFYGEFEGGIEHECTDFTNPNNFPEVIVSAILGGKFRGMGAPFGLLNDHALAEYEKIKQSARAEYEKIDQPARAEYKKIKQSARAEYKKIDQPARAEYKKIDQPAFWDLFAIEENRSSSWVGYQIKEIPLTHIKEASHASHSGQ